MQVAHRDELPRWLARRLKEPLPRWQQGIEVAPELNYGRHAGPPPHDARFAAVLLLLYPDRAGWRIALTQRTATLTSHAGQISLPGGRIEADETVEEAAVREGLEELGDVGSTLCHLGRLSPVYVYASNFLVTPCVAWTPERPDFHASVEEVANLLEPTLVELLDPQRRGTHVLERWGIHFRIPHLEYQDHLIWGATNVILTELLTLVSQFVAEHHRLGDE